MIPKFLERHKPRPHPLHQFFKTHGIKQIVIARYLDVSLSRATHMLLGYAQTSSAFDGKLYALKEQVERESQNHDRVAPAA